MLLKLNRTKNLAELLKVEGPEKIWLMKEKRSYKKKKSSALKKKKKENQTAVSSIAKPKRGRPRKVREQTNQATVSSIAKPKRGRPRKVRVETEDGHNVDPSQQRTGSGRSLEIRNEEEERDNETAPVQQNEEERKGQLPNEEKREHGDSAQISENEEPKVDVDNNEECRPNQAPEKNRGSSQPEETHAGDVPNQIIGQGEEGEFDEEDFDLDVEIANLPPSFVETLGVLPRGIFYCYPGDSSTYENFAEENSENIDWS
ncbi:unnamed protein product [Caenorhabditis sp. 36 PRJEB53466]|nr:unnamed protein product [Caenorhabditis sp. 36 PRJEB53466]